MATKKIKVTAKVIGTSYKCTSYYGNPSYWVTFETKEGETIHAYTANNAACGYACTNFNGKECEITYHHTRSGSAIIDYMDKPQPRPTI